MCMALYFFGYNANTSWHGGSMKSQLFTSSLLVGLLIFSSSALSAQSEGTSSSPQSSATPGSAQRPIRVSGGVMAGNLLNKKDPKYPDTDASGAVVMVAIIDKEGKIVKLDAISGPEALRSAALDSVRKWTYKRYVLNGSTVYVQTTITVMFSR